MPLSMSCSTSSGAESMSVVVNQHNPVTGEHEHTLDEMALLLDQALAIVDTRQYSMNLRMLEVYNFKQYFDDATWTKVVSILDVLAGRQQPGMVVQRWEAALEETRELEEARQQYYHEQLVDRTA